MSSKTISLRLAPTPDTPASPPPPSSLFHVRLERIRAALAVIDEAAAPAWFGVDQFDRLLKTTISLCPECLDHVPALVFTQRGRVFIHKRCDRHGPSLAVLENDEDFYHLSNKDRWGRTFAQDKIIDFPTFEGGCCGGDSCVSAVGDQESIAQDFTDQMSNKSCTVLVEVTDACNLACPVCYSDAKGDRKLPLRKFKDYMVRLIEAKGGLDSVQLTGGEATLHPEFWEMVAFLHAQPGVKKIFLPTNGIVLSDPDVAARLAPFRDRVMVLLQFDGREAATNLTLRNANPAALRDRVIENLSRLKIQMQLTMTLSHGVNDSEAGWVIETGLRNRNIRVIALQPVTYSGRYDLAPHPTERLTLSDLIKAVASQVRRRMDAGDFVPIPCSHPNCGWITLFVRRFGLTYNVVKHVDVERVMGRVANRTLMGTEEFRGVVGTRRHGALVDIGARLGKKLIRSEDVFGVAIKPFMDRFTYDQDRISACCHHLLDTKGRPVSFCEYNARLRASDSWESFPTLMQEDEA